VTRCIFETWPEASLAIVVALIVAACSSGGQAGAPGGSGVAANGAAISITAPADGAEVSVPFDVQLDSTVSLGEPETGDHHAHLYFDTSTDAADYDIVYGTSSQVTRPLEPGQHTITVALANPDHSLAGPTQSITVTVTGSAPAGGPADASPPPATGPGYGY
jgi:hypothetical protein